MMVTPNTKIIIKSNRGHPIAGDDKYGDPRFDAEIKIKGLKRLFLHAHQLTFTNPLTNEIQKVQAPLTQDLQDFLKQL